MTQEHPITPPPKLVQQWVDDFAPKGMLSFATEAARWGSDQELEACIEWITGQDWTWTSAQLRTARRPKTPSLKEQAKFAVAVLRSPDETCSIAELQQHWHTICNALEQLND